MPPRVRVAGERGKPDDLAAAECDLDAGGDRTHRATDEDTRGSLPDASRLGREHDLVGPQRWDLALTAFKTGRPGTAGRDERQLQVIQQYDAAAAPG